LQIPKIHANSQLGRRVFADISSGISSPASPVVSLVGNNIEIYDHLVFLLCYERNADGRKVKLVLQARHKLTGTLLRAKMLKMRSEVTADDPSFSDRMEVGHVLVSLPKSNKIVVGRGESLYVHFI
jgi:hypothetical protein